jgi:hypothetical protein
MYTLFNDEALGSQLYLNAYHLEANAPFDTILSPQGWNFVTDNFTYVDWFCTNSNVPSEKDIAPGTSLAGFGLQSKVATPEAFNCVLGSWDHAVTNTGPAVIDSISAPSVIGFASTLTNAVYSISNKFQFTVAGVPSFSYAVQSSFNLVDWTLLITNTASFIFVETNAPSFSRRFYRSVLVPDVSASSAFAD